MAEKKNIFAEIRDKAKQAGDVVGEAVGHAGKAVGEAVGQAGKAVGEAVGQAGKVVGQAGKVAANKAYEGAKDGAEKIAALANQAKLDYDRNRLKPVFIEDFQDAKVKYSPLLRIIESDKQHEENPVCKGSIGFITPTKDLDVLNIYARCADALGIKYYPLTQEDVYYVDPTDDRFYISLDEYFDYLKKARLDELVRIAHALGAKHVKISFKRYAKTFVDKKANAGESVGKKQRVDAKAEQSTHSVVSMDVVKEASFEGGEPKRPELRYFINEDEIKNLINMKVDGHNPVTQWSSSFKYSKSSGIKEDAAVKIDAALAKMKIKGNASVVYEAQRENRIDFQYEIDFE